MAERIPTPTLGSLALQARPRTSVPCPTERASRGTASITGSGGIPAGRSILRSTRPRARSRPVTRATCRVPPGRVTTAWVASLGTANEVATTQPSAPTTSPLDGPDAGEASAGPPSPASETPATSTLTTAGATAAAAARNTSSSASPTPSVSSATACHRADATSASDASSAINHTTPLSRPTLSRCRVGRPIMVSHLPAVSDRDHIRRCHHPGSRSPERDRRQRGPPAVAEPPIATPRNAR